MSSYERQIEISGKGKEPQRDQTITAKARMACNAIGRVSMAYSAHFSKHREVVEERACYGQ